MSQQVEVRPEQTKAPFLRSRIFLLSALVIICMTVLVGLGKLDISATALTTVFLGIIATVAGLSRRGEELRPIHTRGSSWSPDTLEALSRALLQLAFGFMERGAEPRVARPAARDEEPTPDELDVPEGKAIKLGASGIPEVLDGMTDADYTAVLSEWVSVLPVYLLDPRDSKPIRLTPENLGVDEFGRNEAYKFFTAGAKEGRVYVVVEHESNSDEAEEQSKTPDITDDSDSKEPPKQS